MCCRFDTAGTLLQVLELLLAVRASTSGGDGQLPEATSDATGKNKSPTQSAVLRLLWLADPVKSRCPPVRYAMLQVLQVPSARVPEDTRSSSCCRQENIGLQRGEYYSSSLLAT